MIKNRLRDGSVTRDVRCSLIFDPTPKPQKYTLAADDREIVSVSRKNPIVLDQGAEGMCVGAGVTQGLHSVFLAHNELDIVFAKEKIYWPAQHNDPWDGGSYPGAVPFYEGTTVNAGLMEALKINYIDSFNWAATGRDSIVMMQDGPVVVGLRMFDGMMEPDADGWIHPTGSFVGGHCMFQETVVKDQYVEWCQSWGESVGRNGRVRMPIDEYLDVFADGGEAAVMFPGNPQVEKQYPWWKVLFWKWFGEA